MDNELENGNVQPRDPERKQRERRLAWLVFGLGFSALILGGVQLRTSLRQPFTPAGRALVAQSQQPQSAELVALQNKDTDADGLSDYTELYTYNTSPYIADSDSDGKSDKAEVDGNTDPNCPAGQTCGVISNTNTGSNSNAATGTNTAAAAGDVTATQLRQALLAAGVSQAELDAVDDATLLQNYQAVLATTNSNVNAANTNTSSAATNSNLTVDQLRNLSIADIRAFLQSGGVDETTLNSYDDATLRAVYNQALDEALSTSTNTNGS